MNRARALIVSLAIGLAAVMGIFALGHTVSLGSKAHTATNVQVARQTAQLNRYEASLRKALRQKPPALPPVPSSGGAATSAQQAPARVIYHRPPPVIVIKHRAGNEHDSEIEGGGEDD